MVAKKLSIEGIEGWLENELNGYPEDAEHPDYRKVYGELRAFDPYQGWLPVFIKQSELSEIFERRRPYSRAVSELEATLERGDKGKLLHMPLTQGAARIIHKMIGTVTQVGWFTEYACFARMLDSIRTAVLNWALQLEEDGILGENLSFSPEEKQAVKADRYNITNFFGSVHNPMVQQGTSNSKQSSVLAEIDLDAVSLLLQKLAASLEDTGLSAESVAEAEAEIATLEAQARSPKPKRGILREGLGSLRTIVEGAASGAAGSLLTELGKLLL